MDQRFLNALIKTFDPGKAVFNSGKATISNGMKLLDLCVQKCIVLY